MNLAVMISHSLFLSFSVSRLRMMTIGIGMIPVVMWSSLHEHSIKKTKI